MLEEPEDLAAHLGGRAEQGDGPVGAIGAIRIIHLGLLAFLLLGQRFHILGPRVTQAGVEEERHQQMSDDGQPGLIGDGHGALTPGLRLREVVFPGIEALFFFPPAEIEEGDDARQQGELVGEELQHLTPAGAIGDEAPFLRELDKVTRRSWSTPALAGSGATGRLSVESTPRLLFMRVIIVICRARFLASQKAASMKARSTTHRPRRSRVSAWAS